MNRRIQVIDCCIDCTKHAYDGLYHRCQAMSLKILYSVIVNKYRTPIPEWCPLPVKEKE